MARILVVDDDADFRDVLAFALAWAGHTVVEAADGLEALACLRGETADAILLDLEMPGPSGEDVVAACRRERRWAAVPVVLISGREDLGAVADRLGVAYLRKPVRATDVRRLVDALTTRRRRAAGEA
jgi:CheY-like chemotaxis protein